MQVATIEIARWLLANASVRREAAPRSSSGCTLVIPPQPHWSGSIWAAHMFSRQFSAQCRGAGAGRHADLQAPTLLHATLARVVVRGTRPLSCSCHTVGLRNKISRLQCRVSAYAFARDGRQALLTVACAMKMVDGVVEEKMQGLAGGPTDRRATLTKHLTWSCLDM
jgi:hypothetical protein